MKRRETVDKRHGVMSEKTWIYKRGVHCNHRFFLLFSLCLIVRTEKQALVRLSEKYKTIV